MYSKKISLSHLKLKYFIFLIIFAFFSISTTAFSFGETSGPGYDGCNNPDRKVDLVANPNDCHTFYSCTDTGKGYYVGYLMDCPELTAFQESVQRCEWESEVENCNPCEWVNLKEGSTDNWICQ
jgi:hypothetical protein